MTCRLNHRSGRRRGISLLEVLMSIFVMAVGLLGVLSLLPLAHHEANRGTIEDRKSQVGRAAQHDFRVRGMAAARVETRFIPDPVTLLQSPIRVIVPNNWLTPDGRQIVIISPTNKIIMSGQVQELPGEIIVPAGQSFAIDPRYVAKNFNQPLPTVRDYFPFNVAFPKMLRITLRPGLQELMAQLGMTPNEAAAARVRLFDEIFMAQDDLSIDRPDDGDLPPDQKFTSGANGGAGKRQSDGNFSWMATLVPEIGSDARYTLSIVVFYQRDSQMLAERPDLPNRDHAINERRMVVDFISGGIGGGDVMLQSPYKVDFDDIKSGQWLMISRPRWDASVPPQLPPQPYPVFRWYRIIAAGDEPQLVPGTTSWTRTVTLAGGDWDFPPDGKISQATLVNGVVAVYEKSIQLGTSSLGTQ